MTISVLLRLVPEALADGRIAGRAELVETGEGARVASAEDLVRFLQGRLAATFPRDNLPVRGGWRPMDGC